MFGRLKTIVKRMRQLNAASERLMYFGQRASRIYHRQDCKYGMKIRHSKRLLHTQEQAWAEGFRPCNYCQPDRYPHLPGEKAPGFRETFSENVIIGIRPRIWLLEKILAAAGPRSRAEESKRERLCPRVPHALCFFHSS